MLNAIYHGNLEVSSELRENGDEAFHQLAAERRHQEPFADRRVKVHARGPSGPYSPLLIKGRGSTFNLPDPTDLSNLARPSGRGVLLMRTFMDEVRYNAAGNRVTLVKTRDRV